jgi:hypothetical protein
MKPRSACYFERWPTQFMRAEEEFRAEYRDLESRMKALAEADGDVFLPSPEPVGRVEHIFVCMEPSLGRWARSPDEARSKVEAGFKNFIFSIEDFILHYCIRHYLCETGQRYHITDVSKGAMLVKRARAARPQRYERWYGLLIEELDLVAASGARIFAVGNAVAHHLQRLAFPRLFTKVIHYSGLAARARATGIAGHEDRFEAFMGSVSLGSVLATAEEVLAASSASACFRNKTLARLAKSQLSRSRQQLIFNYKLAFEAARASGSVRDP